MLYLKISTSYRKNLGKCNVLLQSQLIDQAVVELIASYEVLLSYILLNNYLNEWKGA